MEWLVVCLLGVMRTVWWVFLLGSVLVEMEQMVDVMEQTEVQRSSWNFTE